MIRGKMIATSVRLRSLGNHFAILSAPIFAGNEGTGVPLIAVLGSRFRPRDFVRLGDTGVGDFVHCRRESLT